MEIHKRYIELAWRDPKAPSPFDLSDAELKRRIARYEAALAASADNDAALVRRSTMARKKKGEEQVEEKVNGKGKRGRKPKVEAKATGGRPRTGVGATIRDIIKKTPSMPNAEIAEKALKAHPDSSTNASCVAWYKNDMRKKGELKESKKAAA